MTDYQFLPDNISQHIMKFNLDLHPPVDLDQSRAALQGFANALIARFPETFETLVSGPRQFRINKTFTMETGKAEILTMVWGQRGPTLTLPRRLFISGPQEVTGPEPEAVLRFVMQELGERFADRGISRVSVIHNVVFDTGDDNSLDIIAANFNKETWRNGLTNTRLQLQGHRDGKAIAYDIRPTYVSAGGHASWPAPEDARFGVVVAMELALIDTNHPINVEGTNDLMAFDKYYMPSEFINFMNGIS